MIYKSMSVRECNHQIISQNKEYQTVVMEIKKFESFLSDFGSLSFGRDIILCNNHSISLQLVISSCELTMGSIISCCEFGCMADAFSLLRKYRDDLLFYLYIVVYDVHAKNNNQSEKTKKIKDNIERWFNNNLYDLHITDVMQSIAGLPQVKDAIIKYNLQSYFDEIGKQLNNYVHSNGISFYNQNIAYQKDNLQTQLSELLTITRYVTITFFFLLTLCSPLSIMSTDYIDYLECGMTPPNDSQYWVAPFVIEFFKNNLDLIDKSCINYLRSITSMEL